MKVYYSCGLKELAKCSGFRAETLTSLEKCSNFNSTHFFLMQVWEALYREIFEPFCKNRQGTVLPLFDVLSEVHKHLQTTASLSQLQSHIHTKLAATVVERELYEFVEKLSSTDDTRRFWKQFVFEYKLVILGATMHGLHRSLFGCCGPFPGSSAQHNTGWWTKSSRLSVVFPLYHLHVVDHITNMT